MLSSSVSLKDDNIFTRTRSEEFQLNCKVGLFKDQDTVFKNAASDLPSFSVEALMSSKSSRSTCDFSAKIHNVEGILPVLTTPPVSSPSVSPFLPGRLMKIAENSYENIGKHERTSWTVRLRFPQSKLII